MTGMDTPKPTETSYSWEEQDCQRPLPPEAIAGLEYFNAGRYFEAHEELESAWRAEKGPIRELYQGILQVGVGYYHVQRGNYKGAVKMFRRARQWLDPLPDECCGVNLARLRHDFLQVEAELLREHPIQPAAFEFQPVQYRIVPDGKPTSVSK
jgi:predicted metal-dependent hydrolase